MPDSPVRVALLARAGDVREQLRHALTELGAEVVAEGDPADLDPGTVASGRPAVVVVSLEPAIEDALGDFEDLLAMPGVQVIYDDAEVTRQLDGWDLARWARHLASKLAGTDTALLPPAPQDANPMPETEMSLEPGAPPTPAEEMDHHKLEDYAAESLDLSQWVPTTPSLTDVQVDDGADASAPAEDASMELEIDLDLDLSGLEEALAPRPADPVAAPAVESAGDAEDNLDFDDGDAGGAGADEGDDADLGDFLDLSVADSIEMESAAPEAEEMAADEPLLVDFEVAEGPIKFSSFTDEEDLSPGAVDDDVAALAAQLDAFEASDARPGPRDPDFASVEDTPLVFEEDAPVAEPAEVAAPATPAAAKGSFGNLELMPMDGDDAPAASTPAPPVAARPAPAAAAEPARIDFGGLSLADAGASMSGPVTTPEKRNEPSAPADFGMDLAPMEAAPEAFGTAPAAATARGALLVLAGLGGPDGVRQLLSALPPSLPVPVLLYQHLDTGKHERLVSQLAKASKLPLELAVTGAAAAAGRVAVLPPGIGVTLEDGRFSFTPTPSLSTLVAALPAGDSVVLVLSGGDPAVVAAVLALKREGGLVLAQDPASCFDAGAPQSLISSGATSAPLPELARLIIERWS